MTQLSALHKLLFKLKVYILVFGISKTHCLYLVLDCYQTLQYCKSLVNNYEAIKENGLKISYKSQYWPHILLEMKNMCNV